MISIVMPVYKTEYFVLKRAVQSVIDQTFSEWELYIIDDNWKDSAYFEYVKKLKCEFVNDIRIHVIQDGQNKGANVARNIGLHKAKYDIVTFLDSDDVWMPQYLSFVNSYFQRNTDAVLLSVSYEIMWASRRQRMIQKNRKEDIFEKEILGDQLSPTTCVSGRRHVLEEAGAFDETLEARQDYDMWLRACRFGKVGFSDQIFAYLYRDGIGHESISSNYLKHIRATEHVLSKILTMYDLPENVVRKVKTAQYRYLACAAIKNRNLKLARQYAKMMMENDHSLKIRGISWLYTNYFLFNLARQIKIKILRK